MIRMLTVLALIAAPAVAASAQDDNSGTPPQRVRSVTLAPGQTCPKAEGNEVVVCRTLSEPYRIPKELRQAPKETPANTAWGVRADRIMEDNRKVLPGSCSAIGTNGQTGCAMKALEAWAADRNAQRNASPTPQD